MEKYCDICVVAARGTASDTDHPLLRVCADYDYVCGICGLVVRVPGYRTEMYCASCEVRTEFIYVM
jgi:hypothetical protein